MRATTKQHPLLNRMLTLTPPHSVCPNQSSDKHVCLQIPSSLPQSFNGAQTARPAEVDAHIELLAANSSRHTLGIPFENSEQADSVCE